MKFARLYLKAFGPFHDRVIELSNDTDKDFHVLFGPNEAGKSTTLRAVTSFLFGIPERTSDAFLHDYNSLRVGATLVMPDGSSLSAMRRKARKNTLFAIDEGSGAEATDRPLSDGTISGLLGGLDQALYQTLFGLDLNGLVTGSDELLRGEGDLGRSLFQAAAGLASLRNLMTGLDDEAAAAFKPRGSTGRLNRALNEFDEQRRILKDATVRSYAWESAERDYRQAEVKYGQLREALRAKRTEQQRLERIRANLPLLAERAAKQIEVQGLVQVPPLPPEAPQRRVAAQERLRGANETKDAAQARLKLIRAEFDGLIVREKVLAHSSTIEQVFHRVAGYREARTSIPRLAREHSTVLGGIRKLLGEVGSTVDVAQAALLLPSETLGARVQSLIGEYGRLFDRDEQLENQIRGKATALERLNERFALLPVSAPVDNLETSLAGVANVVDLENRGRKLVRDIADADSRLQREAVALWAGPLPELVLLAVPLTETAASYEGDFNRLTQDERVLAEKEATLAGDLEDRRRELKVLAAMGEVVTQTEVAAARGERDDQWTHMRLACVERTADQPTGAADHARPAALADAFEDSIKEADRLADLLHADTQRATNLEATRQRIVDMQGEMKCNTEALLLLAEKRKNLQFRWNALITPLRRPELSPAALREWLSRHQRLVERHGDLENLRIDRGVLDGDISRARTVLDRALVACGLPGCEADELASGALARAQQAVSAARKAQAERGSISDQIGAGNAELLDLRSQRTLVTTRLAEWRLKWAEAAERLSLSTDALPDEARTRLNQFSRLAVALNELQGLDADANNHKAVSASFEAEVAEIARLVDEVAEGRAADAIAERLYAALNENRAAETRRQRIVNDIQRETRTISDADVAALQAEAHLEELVRHAECETPDELPDIESKAARKQTLGERLIEIDEQMVQQNARPIGDVISEADGAVLDDVARQIIDAASEVDDLEGQLETAQGAVFSAKQHLDTINGGAAAAEAQQALSSLAARIAKEARSYARVRLASGVLNRVVQLYRDQHQGPLLKRAAEVFARITLGSFSGLTVDYEDDRQVLLGVRPSGMHISVAGMSQGTRDQLFLSLRVAAIDQHIDGRGPFPVIVDDLLVQFDDDRALATLDVLSELSRKTQVLFFTHHKHLLGLAGKSKLATAIAVQSL